MTILAQLVGGHLDGQYLYIDDPPGQPRPVWLVPDPDEQPAWQWRDLLNPTYPTVSRVGVYQLVRAADSLPARSDDGSYRYEWKGIQ